MVTEKEYAIGEALDRLVIGLAIEVHRHAGPGLLESVYEQCLCHELAEHEPLSPWSP